MPAYVLEGKIMTPDTEPEAEAIIIDGSALVNSLAPRTSKTFEEYAVSDFLPTVNAYSSKYKRTDIVFDIYLESSLKSETSQRGSRDPEEELQAKPKCPKTGADNKTELFHFETDKICEMDTSNIVIVTKGETTISKQLVSLDEMAPCTHEEADTRIFVHARQATADGIKVLMINANDTDVIVIAISALPFLKDLGLQQLWIVFGQGKFRRWIPIHDLNT